MPATIRVWNVEATYERGIWRSTDDPLQALLQSFVDPREALAGPDAEARHAAWVAARLGGTLLRHDGSPDALRPTSISAPPAEAAPARSPGSGLGRLLRRLLTSS
ncbi:transglutaminase-like putative cysteine protease [Deinobacterium chartae]|uniref:Transglutaminase-like putative cysteine protease n=1 Tax=Deinobacterium chartae TaxID=521158 RepID=A0A841HYQ0_9DEIO|nr:hypothetical protein [Deinobacterium chartae]MBB6097794.1 transglutaminase-like putative cysteine protease [Deinobacterium chartae]